MPWLQTVSGDKEATGYCRAEFQDFTKYFLTPLVQKKIQERMQKEGPDSDVAKAVADWRRKFDGAYKRLRVTPQDARKVGSKQANEGLWYTTKNVPREAYKPTTGEGQVPFFVTIDRSTAQNWWEENKKKHLKAPGVPLLQVIIMPTRGHDLHQIVEHAIGTWKQYVYKQLAAYKRADKMLTTARVAAAVAEGIKLFNAQSFEKNLVRLKECCRIVSANTNEDVVIRKRNRQGEDMGETITVKGKAGRYCYKQRS